MSTSVLRERSGRRELQQARAQTLRNASVEDQTGRSLATRRGLHDGVASDVVDVPLAGLRAPEGLAMLDLEHELARLLPWALDISSEN